MQRCPKRTNLRRTAHECSRRYDSLGRQMLPSQNFDAHRHFHKLWAHIAVQSAGEGYFQNPAVPNPHTKISRLQQIPASGFFGIKIILSPVAPYLSSDAAIAEPLKDMLRYHRQMIRIPNLRPKSAHKNSLWYSPCVFVLKSYPAWLSLFPFSPTYASAAL